MMKNYLKRIAVLVFGLFSVAGTAQLVAVNDNAVISGGGFAFSGSVYFNIITNDTYNGIEILPGELLITQVSTTSANVNISGGFIYAQAGTPNGTYIIVYQICLATSPATCATATIIVNVCTLTPPVTSVVQPSCAGLGSINLTGLPTGDWSLLLQTFSNQPQTIAGSGANYLMSDLQPDQYRIKVTDALGCSAAEIIIVINGQYGLTGELNGTYADLNGNGFTDVGDVVNFTMSVTNSLNCPITDITVVETSLSLSGIIIPTVPENSTDTSIALSYPITQDDLNTGTINYYTYISGQCSVGEQYTKILGTLNLNTSDGIRLNAFLDADGDGLQGASEGPFYDGEYQFIVNNTDIHHGYVSQTPAIIYESNPATTYDLSCITTGYPCSGAYSSAVQFNGVTVAAGSGITAYNFPVTVVPCNNVGVTLYQVQSARPDASHYNYIKYTNFGTQTAYSGSITYNNPAVTAINLISEAGAVATSSGFTFDFTNLQPFESRYMWVNLQVPPIPIVALGDQIISTASITVPAGDSNVTDNSATLTKILIAALDPNDKNEIHGGQIVFSEFTSDDVLAYTINFENLGTANAINVVINDILDAKLDESTFRMVDASHGYFVERIGNTLSWRFYGISLAPGGKGHLVFTVKPKPGYAVGDIIPNAASIYFDTNPPIVTSTVTTEFVTSLGAPQFADNHFVVYPNPAQAMVSISFADESVLINKVIITDISGKTVLTQTPESQQPQIDISGFASGIYFARISSGESEKTVKLIKK
jgi:uncharacterized repeat protein (TIGR01451 family)